MSSGLSLGSSGFGASFGNMPLRALRASGDMGSAWGGKRRTRTKFRSLVASIEAELWTWPLLFKTRFPAQYRLYVWVSPRMTLAWSLLGRLWLDQQGEQDTRPLEELHWILPSACRVRRRVICQQNADLLHRCDTTRSVRLWPHLTMRFRYTLRALWKFRMTQRN